MQKVGSKVPLTTASEIGPVAKRGGGAKGLIELWTRYSKVLDDRKPIGNTEEPTKMRRTQDPKADTRAATTTISGRRPTT